MSDPYNDDLIEDAEIDGLGKRSGFGSFLRGLLLGGLVSGAVLLGLTLSHPLPGNLPGIGAVQIEGSTQTVVQQTETATVASDPPAPQTDASAPASTEHEPSVAESPEQVEQVEPQTAPAADSPAEAPEPVAEPEQTAPSEAPAVSTEPLEPPTPTQETSGSTDETTELAAVTPTAPAVAPPVEPEPPALSLSGPALIVNARDFTSPDNAPLMAVVLDNAGNGTIEPDALALLTMPLTLSILPTGSDSTALAESARAARHEILVQMPIATSGEQIGAGILHAGLSLEAIQALTQRSLATLPTALGITPPNGAVLTNDANAMQAVLQPLQEHGFAYIDLPAGSGSVVASLAKDAGLAYSASSRYVPAGATADQIFTGLENAAFQARQRGSAIVRVEASREALTALLRWGLEKDRRPVWFAPVSAVLKRRNSTQ